jgi:hypothetical protein
MRGAAAKVDFKWKMEIENERKEILKMEKFKMENEIEIEASSFLVLPGWIFILKYRSVYPGFHFK